MCAVWVLGCDLKEYRPENVGISVLPREAGELNSCILSSLDELLELALLFTGASSALDGMSDRFSSVKSTIVKPFSTITMSCISSELRICYMHVNHN